MIRLGQIVGSRIQGQGQILGRITAIVHDAECGEFVTYATLSDPVFPVEDLGIRHTLLAGTVKFYDTITKASGSLDLDKDDNCTVRLDAGRNKHGANFKGFNAAVDFISEKLSQIEVSSS